MLDPFEYQNRPFFSKLRKMRLFTRGVMLVENLSLQAWRSLSWVLAFCGLWMIDILSIFGKPFEISSHLVFCLGLAYFLYRDLRSNRKFTNRDIDRRLESESQLPYGQITLLEDNLANSYRSQETRKLWDSAQLKAMRELKRLKRPKSQPMVIRKDPYGLRIMAILFFIAGFLYAGPLWHERITHALWPYTSTNSKIGSALETVKVWITPPSYTQYAKFSLDQTKTNSVYEIPEGSSVEIYYQAILGKFFPPHWIDGEDQTPLNAIDEKNYTLETTIKGAQQVAIKQGPFTPYSWQYKLLTDQPPIIWQNPEKEEKYKIQSNGEIRFPLFVKDDYSVKELKMTMALDPIITDKPLGEPASDVRLVMSAPNTDFKLSPLYDLNWHSWAGLPVIFTFTATDHKGQSAALDTISLTLPEKNFEHPVAKSLIAMKKRLAWEYDSSFFDIGRNLETLLNAPDFLQNDPVIYLTIRIASSRLMQNYKQTTDKKKEIAMTVMSLLWETAIRIEEGNLSLAMRELKAAQRELENAMRKPNTKNDEIARLMENLRQKMQDYFAEMQREMQKRVQNGEEIPQISPDQFSQFISPDTLAKLMESIEEALRSGDQERAQELMSQMQRMMEMMDSEGNPKMPQDMQMMQTGINELQKLIEEQEKLLQKTQDFLPQNTRRNTPLNRNELEQLRKSIPSIEQMLREFNLKPPADLDELPERLNERADDTAKEQEMSRPNAAEQQALRYILGQLMLEAGEKLDDIPENMGLAEQEMRSSEDALAQQNYSSSIPHQEEAITHLKNAQDDLSQQFEQRMQQMVGIGLSGAPQSRDPLGRRYDENQNNADPDGEVEIPDGDQKKALDEVLRELRERSGDRSRSREERDYLRRLLRQF